MMQWMMMLMPLFFFFMFNKYSAGLNYFYFISLLLGALTMWYLRKTTDDKKLLAKLEANYQANKNNPMIVFLSIESIMPLPHLKERWERGSYVIKMLFLVFYCSLHKV
jgi:membrane protein insertase Oxa1/YidC/SpoIIIJ